MLGMYTELTELVSRRRLLRAVLSSPRWKNCIAR